MAINGFTFQRRWTNPEDFPTFETDEAKVRADMQALFDELAAYLNYTVVPRVNADADGLQAAQDAIQDLVDVSVPDNSLTPDKFVPGGAAGWRDISDDLSITSTAYSVNTCEITSNTKFMFSRALGLLFITGRIEFTAVDEDEPFSGLFTISGAGDYVFGASSVFTSRSLYGNADVSCTPSSSSLLLFARVTDVQNIPSDNKVPVYFSGWLFCEEDS